MYKNKNSNNDKGSPEKSKREDNKPKYNMDEIFKKCINYRHERNTMEKINNYIKKYTSFSKK